MPVQRRLGDIEALCQRPRFSDYSREAFDAVLESARGIAVDGGGNAYVSGLTWDFGFPTKDPCQPVFGGGSFDAFITKFSSSGNSLTFSTFLGGGKCWISGEECFRVYSAREFI